MSFFDLELGQDCGWMSELVDGQYPCVWLFITRTVVNVGIPQGNVDSLLFFAAVTFSSRGSQDCVAGRVPKYVKGGRLQLIMSHLALQGSHFYSHTSQFLGLYLTAYICHVASEIFKSFISKI